MAGQACSGSLRLFLARGAPWLPLTVPCPHPPTPCLSLPPVALAAAKDAFSQRMQERGNTNAKFWSAGLLEALGGERHWHQVGLRQLRWEASACRHARAKARCVLTY